MNKLYYTLIFTLIVLLTFGCAEEDGDRTAADAETVDWETKELNTQYHTIKVTKLADGLERPWAVAFLPDGRKLVTERPGRLNVVEDGQVTEITGLPEIHAVGQGGLLDVSLHPDFNENGWIYITYSQVNDEEQTALTLTRGQLQNNEFVNVEELFVQNRFSSPGRHYGSKIAWDEDGLLYVSVGDRGAEPPRAQDNSDHAGTLLRLNDDGTAADGNPFLDDPDKADEIFSYGHRNIQGLIIHPETGEIWATEHGPRGGDELNFVEMGKDYGWPTVSLGFAYGDDREFHNHTEARSAEGMVDPIYEFLPTHAPSGLALVTSNHFPQWTGNLIAGGLRSERIRRLVIDDYEVMHDEELLLGEVGRIRDVREGPDGFIYVVTDEDPGAIYVVEPAEE